MTEAVRIIFTIEELVDIIQNSLKRMIIYRPNQNLRSLSNTGRYLRCLQILSDKELDVRPVILIVPFMNKIEKYNISEYDFVKGRTLEEFQIQELNHVLNSTVGLHVDLKCSEDSVYLKANFVIAREIRYSLFSGSDLSRTCRTFIYSKRFKFVYVLALTLYSLTTMCLFRKWAASRFHLEIGNRGDSKD
ncbi:hypothetical protein CEXT_80071 [Caerostris extrusa]|uniref:Uncharacterized protein n=1 Tax=Caerostris extrusa TaxID=172846 RepID=A0AAV4T0Y6_CAEEX|nr:hypothetical protein CEXT_80071 [Caerostris extrusa]